LRPMIPTNRYDDLLSLRFHGCQVIKPQLS